jgi:hypothetical protein
MPGDLGEEFEFLIGTNESIFRDLQGCNIPHNRCDQLFPRVKADMA